MIETKLDLSSRAERSVAEGPAVRLSLHANHWCLYLEADLRHVLSAGARLEVIVVALEPAHTRPNAIGKLPDKRVVVLNMLVVPHSGHANPVFRTCQFIREALKILIRLQVRI